MRNFYLKENIQNLLSLWHCYGDVSKHQNLRIHGQWPHKVWHEPLLFDEPANVIRGYKRDKPREKRGLVLILKESRTQMRYLCWW
ncbi:hypothetical protein [Pseudoalteromonas sp. MMG012]|uniref:hypothetical protein n=1 Tax=Pseudoalteromonas sp. MMG012 TaxID=2822686 RepID=UPI001B3A44EA|nr:hypothetical protein [Pseudoalteromonas sp. MMG012]MBQ4849669.1 hypothetical protein [Pseudoalteromonas sp. MMG012]